MENENVLVEIVALLTGKVFSLQSQPVKESGFSDLSLRQISQLDLIARLGNPTPTELARFLNITKPSVSAAIDRLEAAGYIRMSPSEDDRRSYHVHLAEKGEQFIRAHEEVHRRLAHMLTGGLDESEKQHLTRLLGKIAQHLKHMHEMES